MAQFPAMPLWTDAYLGDTSHLTTIEHGAYLLLLFAMWRSDGSLPDDDKLLSRYAKLTPGQWARIKPVIMPFFTVRNGRLTQGRLTDELKAVRQHSRKQSDRAKARWLKTKDTGDAAAMPEECQRNASLTLTHNVDIKANALTSTGAGARDEVRDRLCEVASPAAVTSFIAYRRKTKAKALTVTAAQRLASSLRAIMDAGGDPDDALGMAEERGWQTIKPDWYFKEVQRGDGNQARRAADDPTLRLIARAAGTFDA